MRINIPATSTVEAIIKDANGDAVDPDRDPVADALDRMGRRLDRLEKRNATLECAKARARGVPGTT